MTAAAVTPEPSVDALNLAAKQAEFEELDREWNTLHKAAAAAKAAIEASPLYKVWQGIDANLAKKAVELRACGEGLMALERKLGKTDDYTNGGSHVKVGT